MLGLLVPPQGLQIRIPWSWSWVITVLLDHKLAMWYYYSWWNSRNGAGYELPCVLSFSWTRRNEVDSWYTMRNDSIRRVWFITNIWCFHEYKLLEEEESPWWTYIIPWNTLLLSSLSGPMSGPWSACGWIGASATRVWVILMHLWLLNNQAMLYHCYRNKINTVYNHYTCNLDWTRNIPEGWVQVEFKIF